MCFGCRQVFLLLWQQSTKLTCMATLLYIDFIKWSSTRSPDSQIGPLYLRVDSYHCLGSNPGLGMRESYYRLNGLGGGIRLAPRSPPPLTTYQSRSSHRMAGKVIEIPTPDTAISSYINSWVVTTTYIAETLSKQCVVLD